MIRGHKSISSRRYEEEADNSGGMENVANLVDAMLVLACGLMIALITRYNVNLQILDVQTMTEVQDLEIMENDANSESSGSAYNELGVVYQDPETGTMYLISGGE
ncbi:MAG: DUF2149 domain-containing protein [Oscillospiraceae bacterium]|nr:DUF2149 domain-containing protein [Oscillospiraceae bacterium]